VPKVSDREAIIDQLIKLLRAERLRQKRSVNEVAGTAGLHHSMVLRVESRERLPTIDTLLRISDALGVDLSAFLAAAMKSVWK
jgi:transcriptional regulator with XRE-family HTH domain